MSQPFSAAATLASLTSFQRATVAHVMDRYFGCDPTRRFLVADETGLGKSLVARGVIASMIEGLQHDDEIKRIDILYVCSNADIAEQNLTRLNVTGEDHLPFASRLTLLAKESHRLRGRATAGLKPVNLVSFTPGTSFEKGHGGGKAEERALLFILLRDLLDLDQRQQRRARIVLRYGMGRNGFDNQIASLERHIRRYDLDKTIVRAFKKQARSEGLVRRFTRFCDDIGQRQYLGEDEWERCRDLVGALRSALAKASVDCLEPDLIILDEFQRFRHLLDRDEGGPAAELAHDLFNHSDARVLLLSATPYKPFTYAEERADGDDHQRDFLATVRFLVADDEPALSDLRGKFDSLRSLAVAGADPNETTVQLRQQLLQVMCRTERPTSGAPDMLREIPLPAERLDPGNIVDLAALRGLARRLEAPFPLDYWKSVPYFINFCDGYRLGDYLKEALGDGYELADLVSKTQHLDRKCVDAGLAFDAGNARLRALVSDTVDRGWWRLLWVPSSAPYLQPAGPFADPTVEGLTKRLVFSSWSATPTAVAAIVSHHAQRRTTATDESDDARPRRGRLEFRVAEGRPAAMTTLGLLWPNPRLAQLTDPLVVATANVEASLTNDAATAAIARSLEPVLGPDGADRSTSAEAWYWLASFQLDGAVPVQLADEVHHLTLALSGALPSVASDERDEAEQQDPQRLRLHIEQALNPRDRTTPQDRPPDLLAAVASIGMHGPGNVAWRALSRQLDNRSTVTPEGHWAAAATIASGFRSLFNRPDVAALLDQLYPDAVYWRAVLAYCAAGNLQAVLDEYLHHLAKSLGPEPLDDKSLLSLAGKVRDAIAMRPAPYTAFDPTSPNEPITFTARFALRYGNRRQTEGDVRQPLIRNAFNSPFWPFVLATTSVGQEGIDLHWWCHAVVHWNTPASPVDFDQREGRVHRYGGHAIRRNVAERHRSQMLAPGVRDPWEAGYAAATELKNSLGDLSPHWVYPGTACIQRIITPYPLSIDHDRLQALKDDVALYRLALGQPRQEDLLSMLKRRGVQADPEYAASLRLDLAPTPQVW
jgi:hypothetical protein